MTSSKSSPLIDLDRLKQMVEDLDDEEIVGELLRSYQANCESCLASIGECIERGDRVTLKRLAHKLKGSSLIFGAAKLASRLAEIESKETMLSDQDLRGMRTEVVDLARLTLDQLHRSLDTHRFDRISEGQQDLNVDSCPDAAVAVSFGQSPTGKSPAHWY